MLAPSGGGLILYQTYGNLYAMTGRKAHLLEDKKIPSVGVFNETCTRFHQEVLFSESRDDVTGIKQHRHDLSGDGVWILVTALQHLSCWDLSPPPLPLSKFSSVAVVDS
ncbi:hypothetical protein Tco_1283460 [Tanacetum coccineum]